MFEYVSINIAVNTFLKITITEISKRAKVNCSW